MFVSIYIFGKERKKKKTQIIPKPKPGAKLIRESPPTPLFYVEKATFDAIIISFSFFPFFIIIILFFFFLN